MHLTIDRKRLDLTFVICLALTLGVPVLFPSAKLTFFAPFLIVACYQSSLKKCLWLAIICGFIVDLLSSYTRFGLYPLDYCLTVALLYPQRRNFFADSLSTLPIMTFLFSLLSTIILSVALYSIEAKHVFSKEWAFTDLLIMPGIDALFAFVVFIIPPLLFGKRRRRGKDYFLSG